MPYHKLHLTAMALFAVGLPFVSQAAVYTVELAHSDDASRSSVATAISENGTVAVEQFSGPDGIDFSQELPLMIDVAHVINSYDDMFDYCVNNLNYATCDVWASEQWYGLKSTGEICTTLEPSQVCRGGYSKQIQAWTEGYVTNRSAFSANTAVDPFASGVTQPTLPPGTVASTSTDVVINRFSDTNEPVGTSSSPFYQDGSVFARAFIRRGFVGQQALLPASDANTLIQTLGQTNANGQFDATGVSFVYGSASVANMASPGDPNTAPEGSGLSNLESCATTVDYSNRACQYFQFANQAVIWPSGTNTALTVSDFPSGATGNTNNTAQATISDAAALTSAPANPLLVGFSTYNENQLFSANAVIYRPVGDTATCLTTNATNPKACWEMTRIPGTEVRKDGDLIYRYSRASSINDNGIVVGELKNANLLGGAYAKQVFVYDASQGQNASAQILTNDNASIFINSYNATAAAINNDNELVGKVDVESSRERQRRQRGYIYLHGNATHLNTFNNVRGWLLDDLTNDGVVSGANVANAFRIAEAYDINNNGDISASAFYCENGYESLAKNARCLNGEESLVAVKLTRQSGTIQPRPVEEEAISRSGAGTGIVSFIVLLLAGLSRRKFNK